MRTYSPSASNSARLSLDGLLTAKDSLDYRLLMNELGRELAGQVALTLPILSRVLLICTTEDADFLASGLLGGLEDAGIMQVALACFWIDRQRLASGVETGSILRRYVEPIEFVDTFIVVKSIISSACTVRTSITELVFEKNPKRIIIAAPVILDGSSQNLECEFAPEIASRFEYIWFASDDSKKANGEVVPGIGGSVYELLGLGDAQSKNRYIPEIVKRRRAALVNS